MAFKSVVLKTVDENTANNGTVYGMWIIGYYKDGAPIAVKIVCGEKKTKDDGDIWYAAKGLVPKDFEKLKPVYAEFLALCKNQPPLAPAPVAPADEPYDEVPF